MNSYQVFFVCCGVLDVFNKNLLLVKGEREARTMSSSVIVLSTILL